MTTSCFPNWRSGVSGRRIRAAMRDYARLKADVDSISTIQATLSTCDLETFPKSVGLAWRCWRRKN